MEEFSGRDVGIPEYVLETNTFRRINGVSTVFTISRYSYGRMTAGSGTTVALPYPRNPIRPYCCCYIGIKSTFLPFQKCFSVGRGQKGGLVLCAELTATTLPGRI